MARRPSLFIGSSVEGLSIARAVQQNLDRDAEVTVWDQNVFEPSEVGLESLVRQLDSSDFGAFVFSPDDDLVMRGDRYSVARDNVVFEIGLAIGKLGPKRAFILIPRDAPNFHLPSDLLGINPITYDPNRADGNIVAALGAASDKIRQVIRKYGAREISPRILEPVDPRRVSIIAARRLEQVVSVSYGPRGQNVGLPGEFGHQFTTRRGSLIARYLKSNDAIEEHVLALLRVAAFEAVGANGDGAKTAVLIATSLVQSGQEAVFKGFALQQILEGMEAAVKAADAFLAGAGVPDGDLSQVASTAAGDPDIGAQVVDAITKAGANGLVLVEESGQLGVEVTMGEGVRFDRGYISSDFVNDSSSAAAILDDCLVLLYSGHIRALQELIPILEKVAQAGRPLLTVAEQFEPDVIATLVLNNKRGVLRSVAVRAPGFADRQREQLKDLAALTGARMIDPTLGMVLSKTTLDDLGRARRVRCDAASTAIIEGAGSQEEIDSRANLIRAQIAQAASDYDREKLIERLAHLCGTVVTILVGGPTEGETTNLRYRVESALWAATSAARGGMVNGAGISFIRAKQAVLSTQEREAARLLGRTAVLRALEQPLRCLARSVHLDEGHLLDLVERGDPAGLGPNVLTGNIEDVRAAGIADALPVARGSLMQAYYAARAILNTETWEVREEPGREVTASGGEASLIRLP